MEMNMISGSNAPQTTNVLMGVIINKSNNLRNINIDVELLSDLNKKTYNDFFELTGNHLFFKILNSSYSLEANRVTPMVVEEDNYSLDYKMLKESEKPIVDDFLKMIFSITKDTK